MTRLDAPFQTNPHTIWGFVDADGNRTVIGPGEDITIIMEAGQHGPVPWLQLWRGDSLLAKINVAHLQCVCYDDPKEYYTQYEHHGTTVWVASHHKGIHRYVCLCFACEKFKPGTEENCPIAQAVYENCVEHGITTPMW